MQKLIVDEKFRFDDESKGIKDEPFVQGADSILKMAVEAAGVGYPFSLSFDSKTFPGAHMATKVEEIEGGAVYSTPLGTGWLCPCLMRYFASPPDRIFFSVGKAD